MPTSRPGRFRPLASAVIEIDEVFDASTPSAPTMGSSSRKSARLASAFSTIASTTRPQPAASSSRAAAPIRAAIAFASAPSSLPLAARPSSVAASFAQAACAAPSRVSKSRTGWPACAATWAMPAPMMPAPTTKTVVSERSSNAMAVAVRCEAAPRGSGAPELSASAAGGSGLPGPRFVASRSGRLRRCRVGPLAGLGQRSGGAHDVADDDDRRRAEALARDDRGERVEATDRVALPGQAGVLDDRDRRRAGEAAREARPAAPRRSRCPCRRRR